MSQHDAISMRALRVSSSDAGSDAAAVPFIPKPIQVFVGTHGGITAITRVWKPGDTRLCRLCPRGCCCADHALGVCQIMTDNVVSNEEAPLYRSGSSVPPDHA
jgi:hypothetical protein